MHILITILIGAVVGYLAGIIMKCSGSWLRNIILGVVAGALSGWLLGPKGLIIGIVCDVAVACLLIWLGKKFFK